MNENRELVSWANTKANNNSRYFYESLVGEGSFGTVLKAKVRYTGKYVAVKIIEAKRNLKEIFLWFHLTPPDLQQGRNEVNLLRDLRHKNIIAFQEHFEFTVLTTTYLAIVMDYCSQGNLQTYLETLETNNECISEERRLLWFKQLASALKYIHQKGVAHRDLKPANILVDDTNSYSQLKVADVGIAKVLHDNLAMDSQYAKYMKTVAGTPPYMAPEIFGQHYTLSVDIFSMGLVMFMISEHPISGDSLVPMVYCVDMKYYPLGYHLIVRQESRALKATSLLKATRCPKDEQDLFDSMLKYNHCDRPTAAGIVDKLQRIENERRLRRVRQEEGDQRRRNAPENQQELRWCSLFFLLLSLLPIILSILGYIIFYM